MQIRRFFATAWEFLRYTIEGIPFGRYVISASAGIVMMMMCLWGRGWFDLIVINPVMPWQSFPTVTIDWSNLPSAFSIFVTPFVIGGSIWLSVLLNRILNADTSIG
jgi:hypothetical protein